MLYLFSSDIYPNPVPSPLVESPGETGRYNVPTVLSGCTFPARLSLAQFRKISQGTPGPIESAFSIKLLPVLLYLQILNFKKEHCKQTIYH